MIEEGTDPLHVPGGGVPGVQVRTGVAIGIAAAPKLVIIHVEKERGDECGPLGTHQHRGGDGEGGVVGCLAVVQTGN